MYSVSFVIPCYRSENTLPDVVREIQNAMRIKGFEYEIILVNDCSPDHTFSVIRKLCIEHQNVTGIDFSKNFGQHAALMAGLAQAQGDVVVCLDDDGQTPADEVYKLLAEFERGQDVVYARYTQKKHSWTRNIGSKFNELMSRWLLDKPKDLYISSYFAARRFVVDEILKYDNPYPYVIGLILRTTKNISNVDVTHRERKDGQSGYNFRKLFSLWMNGFTAFSVKPLRVASLWGAILSVLSGLAGIWTVIHKIINPDTPVGWSSMICAIVFVGGIMMIMLGLIGEYLGRLYISQNKAPQYVVREILKSEKRGTQINVL